MIIIFIKAVKTYFHRATPIFLYLALASPLLLLPVMKAEAFQTGEILLGQGDGKIYVYHGSTLNRTLNVGITTGYYVYGTCISTNGEYVYATSAGSSGTGRFTRFNKSDVILNANWFSFGPGKHPVACAVDAHGNIFVGLTSGGTTTDPKIRKYNQNGELIETYSPETNEVRFRYFDISRDQCTLLYTSGRLIKRFDVCTRQQLTDFADLSNLAFLPGKCSAIKIRKNGEVMVACSSSVGQPNERNFLVSLGREGNIVRGYDGSNYIADAPGPFKDFFEIIFAREREYVWAALRRPNISDPPVQDRLIKINIESGAQASIIDMPDAFSYSIYGTPTATTTECSDGMDNDDDGVIDFPDDSNCQSGADKTERRCVTITIGSRQLTACMYWVIPALIALAAFLSIGAWRYYRRRER